MVTEGIGSAYDVFANKASKFKNYGINEIGEDDMAKVYIEIVLIKLKT
jgi:hypothetical protein